MKISATLLPVPYFASRFGVEPLRLVWDSEAGTVTGPDRERVMALIPGSGPFTVSLRVSPESAVISDPLRDPLEMAILLGTRWDLPPELEALYPELGAVPEDAVA